MEIRQIEDEATSLKTGDGKNEVWMYVNPITGRYARLKDAEITVAFTNEEAGRRWENQSKVLKTMVGHYVSREELIEIANAQTEGRYVIADQLQDL